MDHDRRPPDRSSESEDHKGGRPPRPAPEPQGGGVAHRQDKTATDPSTGEHTGEAEESEKA